VRNPNYWEKGKPYLDGFKYFFVGDELTRVALFKSGGAEVLNTNGNGRIGNALKDAGYNIVTQLLGPNMLVPDSANPDSPWSNLKVRQAAEYAIDKESIATTFGAGWWRAVYQFSNPSSKAYDSTIAPRKYDVAKAKQLLTEAGYPNGFKTSLIAAPLQLNRDVVLAIQAQLAKVGIQADTQFPESAKWSEISTNTWKNAILYTSVFVAVIRINHQLFPGSSGDNLEKCNETYRLEVNSGCFQSHSRSGCHLIKEIGKDGG
jgi:peptide/nickel transport system substrate-binding protein